MTRLLLRIWYWFAGIPIGHRRYHVTWDHTNPPWTVVQEAERILRETRK